MMSWEGWFDGEKLFSLGNSGVSEYSQERLAEKRRFSCEESLRVEALGELIELQLNKAGYGPSFWTKAGRLPTQQDKRQMAQLYRWFVRSSGADISWFKDAADAYFGNVALQPPPAPAPPIGDQVVVGVEEIANATRRSPAGVLRLIQGGKLPVVTLAGQPTSTQDLLRPYRRYGETAVAA
jgi:hypothetical protein